MKILVTGGVGFIGSNFIRYILKKYPDYYIFNLDKLTYAGRPENLTDLADNPRYQFIKGDICDREIVNQVMADDVEIVVHFAAESHVDRSIVKPDDFLQTNVFGTYILLEAARKFKIKKFIYISTDEVYGSIKTGKFKEDDPLKPSSPYSASKAAADLLAQSYHTTYNLPVIVTRSSNNFGPYQFPEKLIPLFITNLLSGKKVPLYGTGKNRRDWIYVLDNCQGIDFVLHRGKIGEVYNIGGNNEKENIEITKIILRKLGKDLPRSPRFAGEAGRQAGLRHAEVATATQAGESWIQPVADRPGHDWRYAIDCAKIKKLGWQPKYNFGKAIDETIEWYQKNEWWWKPLIN